MKHRGTSIIAIMGFLGFLVAPASAQYILFGTAYQKSEIKGCALFPTGVGMQFKNFGPGKVEKKVMYDAFKAEMIKTYPKAQVQVFSSSEPHGFVISARKKHFAWECTSTVYYSGFGKTMLEAIERAEKALSDNCKDCTTLTRTQL